MAPPIPTLSYAKRGKGVRPLVTAFAVCGALGFVIVLLFRQGIPQRVAALYWYRRCATYAVAPDTVVYEEHNAPDATWSPRTLAALPLADRSGTRRMAELPPAFRKLDRTDISAWNNNGIAPLFLGTLRTPSGAEQVVLIALPGSSAVPLVVSDPRTGEQTALPAAKNGFTSFNCVALGTYDETPGVIRALGEGRYGAHTVAVFTAIGGEKWSFFFASNSHVYRFYAGQRDSADASHVTVDFDADNGRMRMHCRLVDLSHVRVSFEPLDPVTHEPLHATPPHTTAR